MNGTAGPAAHLAPAASSRSDGLLCPRGMRSYSFRTMHRKLQPRVPKLPNKDKDIRDTTCKGFMGLVKYTCDLIYQPAMAAVVVIVPGANKLRRLHVVSTDDSLHTYLESGDFLGTWEKEQALRKLETPGDREAKLLAGLNTEALQHAKDGNTVYGVMRRCLFFLWKGRLPAGGEGVGGMPDDERAALLSLVEWPLPPAERNTKQATLKKLYVGNSNKKWFHEKLVPLVLAKVKEVSLAVGGPVISSPRLAGPCCPPAVPVRVRAGGPAGCGGGAPGAARHQRPAGAGPGGHAAERAGESGGRGLCCSCVAAVLQLKEH